MRNSSFGRVRQCALCSRVRGQGRTHHGILPCAGEVDGLEGRHALGGCLGRWRDCLVPGFEPPAWHVYCSPPFTMPARAYQFVSTCACARSAALGSGGGARAVAAQGGVLGRPNQRGHVARVPAAAVVVNSLGSLRVSGGRATGRIGAASVLLWSHGPASGLVAHRRWVS